MNVNKVRLKNRAPDQSAGPSRPESDFDDLENWEDVRITPDIEDQSAGMAPEMVEPAAPIEPVAASSGEIQPERVPAADLSGGTDDEFSPVVRENATPISLRPRLGLTKVERIGMIALAVVLLAGGVAILMFSLGRLPTESVRASANDFPIKGSHLTVTSATSYWRPPIMDGVSPDTFRRGTQLLPVLDLKVSGGPAVVRVQFRNDERAIVGDAVTRAVHGDGTLTIPATAGFDDLGMHAAYRTGGGKRWTIEVYEAPSEETAGKEFKKLFEMNVSTDRR